MGNRIYWGILTVGAALAMTLAACVYRPVHPTKSDHEWAEDHESCERSVREIIRDEPYAYDTFDEMRMIRECMLEKGWERERIGVFLLKTPPEE